MTQSSGTSGNVPVAVTRSKWNSNTSINQKISFHCIYFGFFVLTPYKDNVGWDSAVGIATRYRLNGPGSNPGGDKIFHIRPAFYTIGTGFTARGKAAVVWRSPLNPF